MGAKTSRSENNNARQSSLSKRQIVQARITEINSTGKNFSNSWYWAAKQTGHYLAETTYQLRQTERVEFDRVAGVGDCAVDALPLLLGRETGLVLKATNKNTKTRKQ
jgi:hypothetical protein